MILDATKDAFGDLKSVLLVARSYTKRLDTRVTKRMTTDQNFLGHSLEAAKARAITFEPSKMHVIR